jgi:hypothetical protein
MIITIFASAGLETLYIPAALSRVVSGTVGPFNARENRAAIRARDQRVTRIGFIRMWTLYE